MTKFIPSSADQEVITINIAEDSEKNIPPCRIYLYSDLETNKEVPKMILSGFVRILNRNRNKCTDYPMEDCGASIKYNSDKQIVQISLYQPTTDTVENELEDFIMLTKDEDAAKAYSMLAWYWSTITFGYLFINGLEKGIVNMKVLDQDSL